MVRLIVPAAFGFLVSCLAYAVPFTVNVVPTGQPLLFGVTFDDVSGLSSTGITQHNAVLTSLLRNPAVRIVFDTGQDPTKQYLTQLTAFHPNATVMGLLADSTDMPSYTVQTITTWTQNYYNVLKNVVDIWEIGNEVNGDWLSTLSDGSDVLPKVEAMYDNIVNCGGGGCGGGSVPKTALTFFYEGEPTDPNNCINTGHGGNDMFTWINTHFQANPTTETERIRLNVNYVLVSWYPNGCNSPAQTAVLDMPTVFSKLSSIFPNSRVGFGEIGLTTTNLCTASILTDCAFLKSEIDTYYSTRPGVGGLPNNYIVGCFLWEAAEWLIPWPGVTNAVFPNGMGVEVNSQLH